ncbi:MAG: serine hydrolase domain-containing protein [Bacteroidota bacterium]
MITFIISPLLLTSSLALQAGVVLNVDSIVLTLDHQEKVRSLLWVEVNSMQEVSAYPIHNHFYLSEATETEDFEDIPNASFAKRLDHSMNPTSDKWLPDLYMLASINDVNVLNKYFTFFHDLGVSMNFQYMVLPESENQREQQVIRKLHEFDPGYFINPDAIYVGVPSKKKEVKALFENDNFWLVTNDQYARADELIEKLEDKILLTSHHDELKKALLSTMVSNNPEIPEMSHSLRMNLLKTSVALLEKSPILPLQTDTLCLISKDPYGEMANVLRHYVYLITDIGDILKSKAPILADYNPMLPDIFQGRDLIFMGTVDEFDPVFFNTGLLVPLKDEKYDYLLPQQLFGSISISGSIIENSLLDQFTSRSINSFGKLGFAPPESVGLSMDHLDSISRIIENGINQHAFPGCQLAMAIGGSVVYDKSFGYLTYDSLIPVYHSTLFDLASVTKVAGSLMMAMKLYDEQKLDLDQTISYYLPRYAESNKKQITIKSLLSHQAGLLPYVPFWKRVLSGDMLDSFYYASIDDELKDQRSYGMQPTTLLRDSLSQWILSSPLLKYDSVPYYSYSDIGFMIIQQVLEEIAGMPMDEYLDENFYRPLGLNRMLFNPRQYAINLFEIAPTEYDSYYRSEQIWGKVHDRNAAILDGVAGHAGLFANAQDMLVLFQMALQGGTYNGKRFFSQETLNTFNKQYFPDNRRGLGWDKKSDIVKNVSDFASDESYGHTGFTGTMVWVDPKYDLVFVFLSNRVHPNADNRKLNELDIRTKIQDIVYEAIQSKNH